jgi:hypothetical protein
MRVLELREQLNTKGAEITKLTKEKKDSETRVRELTEQVKNKDPDRR